MGHLPPRLRLLPAYVNNPTYYVQNPGVFGTFASQCVNFAAADGSTCTYAPASDGTFRRMFSVSGLYAEDSWRVSHQLTLNYGLRYQTTWGLFQGSGRSEADNAAYVTLQALQIPIVPGLPTDYRKQIAPRLGVPYPPGESGRL